MDEFKSPEHDCDGNCAGCSGCSQSHVKPARRSMVIFGILVVVCIIVLIVVSKFLL